jgi:hypothetical protein
VNKNLITEKGSIVNRNNLRVLITLKFVLNYYKTIVVIGDNLLTFVYLYHNGMSHLQTFCSPINNAIISDFLITNCTFQTQIKIGNKEYVCQRKNVLNQ